MKALPKGLCPYKSARINVHVSEASGSYANRLSVVFFDRRSIGDYSGEQAHGSELGAREVHGFSFSLEPVH